MWKLLPYLKNYKKESIIGPLFKLLEACFELLVPVIMANIIDIGIKEENTAFILKMAGVMVLFGVLGLACSLTAQYFAAKASVGFGTALRDDLFAHMNSLSYAELDYVGTSTLITRITSDMNQVQSGVNLVLRLFLRSPFIVAGALVMAFFIDVKTAWIFVLAIPVLSVIIYGIMLLTIPLYKKVQKALDKITLATRESLIGVRVVRAFGRQASEQKEFEEDSQSLRKVQQKVGSISAALNPLTYAVVNAAIIAIVWQGGIQVNAGRLSQGEVIALWNYMNQILLALVALANLIVTFTKALASASRINEVFACTSTLTDNGTVTAAEGKEEAPKIMFRHLSFTYPHAKEEALSDISFSAKKGETIGIIGGTGSGKTSVVHLIPRFYEATKGAVLYDGIDVREYSLEALRAKIGIVPQKAVLFAGTVRENMKWGKKDATDEEIYEALEIAQAKEFIDAKEEGLDLKLAQGGKNLSGGQRQRLTIARALVRKPEVLILDDSASALDFATDAKLRRAIAEKTKGMTVFLVSQRATTIKQADRILVLEDGELVGNGKHEELFETCEVYREICLSQLSDEEAKGGSHA